MVAAAGQWRNNGRIFPCEVLEPVPRIDVRCQHGHISEVVRPLADWPNTPPCPECGASTEQIHLPRQTQWTCDPVIVYKASDGSFRFPGDTSGVGTHKYDRLGYERIELRSAADVRRFETVMNKRELSRASRRVEAMQAAREARESETRRELRRQMESMSERGRAVARAAMSMNDNKRRESAKEVGFHVEAFSYDHSNRDESRDAQGRRRRD
jgi:hypothetical protein